MAFEVACSECEGRLMVEEAGVIVACPHCGAHLNIEAPAEPAATDESTSVPDVEPAADSTEQTSEASAPIDETPQPAADLVAAETVESASSAAEGEPTTAKEAPAFPSFDSAPETRIETTPISAMPSVAEDSAESASNINDSPAEPASETTPGVTETADAPPQPEEEPAQTETFAVAAPAEAAPSQSGTTVSAYAGRGVSRHTFSLVRNYAIAMTIAVIFLVYKLLNPNMSALESLPDVKPQKKDDKIVYKLVPESTEMPPGHLLSLGQSQRFGNLRVTPVRITKEPVEFVHHLGDTGVSREPGAEVVKLWFEFENLSTDQHIAPLDGLVFKRDDNDFENVRSNNFACRLSQKKKGGELAFVYDLNEFDIWNLRDQHVSQEIAPGEKLETYIPTSEEGVDQLLNSDEPLIWRVHFRKGYSPQNYGVTTVIEVAFESSDIGTASVTQPVTDEPAAAPNA